MGKVKIDVADKNFSLYIRTKAGWRCERCFTQYTPPTSALHTSHFYGRARENTRFDPQNVAALCYGCHRYFTAQPEEHRQWFVKRLGQKEFDLLTLRANTYKKKDRKMEALRWKVALQEIR